MQGRPLAVARAAWRRLPHLSAFFPDHRPLPAESAPEDWPALVLDGIGPAWRPGPAGALVAAEALWRAPRFGTRHAPVAMLVAADATGLGDPLRLAIAAGAPADLAHGLIGLLREARVGGAPGLPDPGADGLGLPRGGAVIVLDPGRPGQA
ncbi:MAG: hypothetical protein K2X49_10795, partial [Acetobacteraceae bacterium]|nr:hypothetical protein [Acetobacteraceae bacterium]